MMIRGRACSRRRRWRRVEENGGGVTGDGKGFPGSETAERGAGEAERPAVVGVGSSEVVTCIDSVLHKAAPLLAPPHSVLVVELRRRATHSTVPTLYYILYHYHYHNCCCC